MTEITLKRCRRKDACLHPDSLDGWLPASKENFHRESRARDGFRSECKVCHIAEVKAYRCEHIDQRREYERKHRSTHAEQLAQYRRSYYARNADAIHERDRVYRENNKERRRERSRAYYQQNRDKLLEQVRVWSAANRNRVRVITQRKRARRRSLPKTLTVAEWQYALEYFNGCCAVCGRQLSDLFGSHVSHADHWIPISSPACTGTVATNIVPLCGGVDGCNNRKGARDPVEFLETEFGKRRAQQILTRIESYFASDLSRSRS